MREVTRSKWRLCCVLATTWLATLAGFARGEERPASWPIAYQVAESGRVSIALYDAEGRLLRELMRGQPHQPGQYSVAWDGLTADGAPVAPGRYEWRLLRTPGFKAEYVTSLGIRPGSARYDSWVGNHGGTASVAVDQTGVYLASQVTETAPVLLKQSLDGKKRFWTRGRSDVTDGRFQGGVALASNGKGTLYMLQQNGLIQVINAEDGELRVDLIGRGANMGDPETKGTPKPRKWDPLPDEVKARIKSRPEIRFLYRHRENIGGADLAASGDIIVITFEEQNTVRWLNPVDGSVTKAVQVPAPLGVTVAPDGRVFVISEKRVVEVQRDGAQRVVVQGLINPVRLCFEPKGGDLLVVEREPDNRIKRYSLDGQLLKAYGREGGRKDGVYVATDFLGVTCIAADGRGGFLITEEAPAPRRAAHFDRDGVLINEWYGGQPYYAYAEPDPRDPAKVWFNPGGWLTLAEVDYLTGAWRVLENYNVGALAAGLARSRGGNYFRWRALVHDGKLYLVSEGEPQVLVHQPGQLRAVSVLSSEKERVAEAAKIAGLKSEAEAFRWFDRNGDGAAQADEFTFAPADKVPNGRALAEDFEIVGIVSIRKEGDRFGVTRTRPTWTPQGPLYPIGDEPGVNTTVAISPVPGGVGIGGNRGTASFRDRDGNYYATYNTGDDRHGTSWPTDWGAQSRLVKWNPEGLELWRVGRHAIHGGLGKEPHTTPPGYIHVACAIIGEVRDTVILTDRVEWMGMVWTKDGLYVGDVLDGRVNDGLPDKAYYWWRTPAGEEAIVTSDNATGGAIIEAADGSVYFYTQGRNSIPTYRIHGWDGWQRAKGEVTVAATPAHAAGKGTGLTAAYYDRPEFAGQPKATRVDTRVWHGIPRKQEGSDNVLDGFAGGPAYDWSKRIEPLGKKPGEPFSVRFTGMVEAPLSETFIFSVYARGKVRLWIEGQEMKFAREDGKGTRFETKPIALEAGRRYAVRLDFTTDSKYPGVSLNWESPSIDRRRIPSRYLYPDRQAAPAAGR